MERETIHKKYNRKSQYFMIYVIVKDGRILLRTNRENTVDKDNSINNHERLLIRVYVC